MIILAIDLGKFNSMCCFFNTQTQEYRFQAATTTRSYLTAVLKNHKIDLVIMGARKIAVVAWAMLKHQTDWDPQRLMT